jgi:hypothetical protein
VSKEELLRNVWRNMFVSDSVITQSIMKARRALGDDGGPRTFIRTVHRVGYKFDEELICSEQMTDEASGRAPQLVLVAQHATLGDAGHETLAKAAEVMARELTRLGLSVRQVNSSETAESAADMAVHIGLALRRSLSSPRGVLVDIAPRPRRTETA